MKLFLITISFVLVSCNGQKKAALNEEKMAPSELENQLELIMQEPQGGFDADEILVIKDEKRLKNFFSKINRTRKPGLPVPDIDFLKDMVIIQCVGEESHSRRVILSVQKETETQMILKAVDQTEIRDSSNDQNYGSFGIYKMPLSTKEIILDRSIE